MLEIFLIFVMPIVVLVTGVLPISLRHWLGVPVLILLIYSIRKERWGLRELGIRTDNLRRSLSVYAMFILIGLAIIFLMANIFNRQPAGNWYKSFHFQFFFLLTSFFQEFAYRGYLVPKLKQLVHSPVLQILINASLFSALHYFFPQPELVLPATFILGMALTMIYMKYPNWLLVSIAHSMFNFAAVLFCFASLDTSCLGV